MPDEQIAALVLGITELSKNAGVPSKYCPFLAVGLGITIKILEALSNGTGDYFNAGLRGALIGLATTGIYSAVDGMVKKSSTQPTNGNSSQETH